MDIAKIRKKAQGQAQTRIPDAGDQVKPEEPMRNDVAEPAQGQPVQAAEEAETRAETAAGSLEVPAGADNDAAGPVVPAGPGSPGTGGVAVTEPGAREAGVAELLTFSLAKEEFAFKVSEVEEIIRFQRITLVPTMPVYVAGITSLRGKIIPVIDLRARLALKDDGGEVVSLPKADADGLIEGTGKIIVLSGPLGLIGAIIDKILGVVRLPDDVILEPPAHLTEDETKFIEGVVIVEKRFISIIRSADALNIEVG